MQNSVVLSDSGKRIDLPKDKVLDSGGEALIFEFSPQKVIKVYHDPTPHRGKKLLDWRGADFQLPPNICSPLELAHDGQGNIVGFVMKRLSDNCESIGAFGNRKWRTNNSITTKTVVQALLHMGKTLSAAHNQGIVVGDVNDKNEVLNGTHDKVAWIDVDSWQWKKYPCMVGTKDFLHPDLYGVDLSQSPQFKAEHDWWSYAVILCRSLLRVHPFRSGIHPDCRGTMDRATAGITVLDSDVQYPGIGISPETLSDDMLDVIVSCLKRKETGFPLDSLKEFGQSLVECSSCGLWHAQSRKQCPGCQTKTVANKRIQRALVDLCGEEIIKTPGSILYFQISGKNVFCLADEKGKTFLYRKDGKGKLFNTRSGARYKFFGNTLIVCPETAQQDANDLLLLDVSASSPKPILKTTTESLAGHGPVFSTSGNHLYRIAGGKIMRGELFGKSGQLVEREVVPALSGQTWFTADRNPKGKSEILLGFHRIFDKIEWWTVRSDESGHKPRFKRFDVNLPETEKHESLIDLSVRFGDRKILILRKTRKGGVDHIRFDVVGTDGDVVRSRSFEVDDAPVYRNLHGKAFRDGNVLHPSQRGIVQEFEDGSTNVLTDSSQFVTQEDSLYPYGGGLLVVKDDRVVQIKPKSR